MPKMWAPSTWKIGMNGRILASGKDLKSGTGRDSLSSIIMEV